MVQFARHLYLDEKAASETEKICRAVKEGKTIPGLYITALAANPAEQLDLFSCRMFQHAVLRGKNTLVVALAFGRKNAEKLIAKMAREAYERTGDCNLRTFLEEGSV